MKFSKWHGLGNDFILVNCFEESINNPQQLSKEICDRHLGVGADGLVLVLPSDKADFRMQIFNSDGSEAQMCGNASRCFSSYVYRNGLTNKKSLQIETLAGIVSAELINDGSLVRVNLGAPKLTRKDIPVSGQPEDMAVDIPVQIAGATYLATCVSTGVPHCVIFVETFNDLDWISIGKQLEVHHLFPEKTNVEFIQVLNPCELVMKVWERGAGVTMACGTGASASVVAGVLTGKTERRVTVHLDGGDLQIEWNKESGHVIMTQPALQTFLGEIGI